MATSTDAENMPLAKCQSTNLKTWNLQRHTLTQRHQSGEAEIFNSCNLTRKKAPSPKDFKAEWDEVRQGQAKTLVKNRRKHRLMEWCIAEALRSRQRSFLRGVASLSMNSDARQGRLLMRWSGTCKDTLEVHQGVLGLERDFGTGSEAHDEGGVNLGHSENHQSASK